MLLLIFGMHRAVYMANIHSVCAWSTSLCCHADGRKLSSECKTFNKRIEVTSSVLHKGYCEGRPEGGGSIRGIVRAGQRVVAHTCDTPPNFKDDFQIPKFHSHLMIYFTIKEGARTR
jgi:hypothetical protein